MVQRGVTLADVDDAIASLVASGRAVSARSVRHALGDRGSLTTIARHLRAIRAREDEQRVISGSGSGPALPDPVVQGLILGAQKHWDALNDAAESIIDQEQARAAERVEAARDAEQAAKAEAAAACAEQAKAATALAETQSELEALRPAHAALVEEHRSLGVTLELNLERQRGAESLAEERRGVIENTTAALERTTSELNAARTALERARTEAVARERGLMEQLAAQEGKRGEAEQALAHVRGELRGAESQLERARADRISIERVLEETREALDSEQSRHAATARDLATHRERCDGLRTALSQSQNHSRSLAGMLERATERAAAAEAALQAMQAVEALDRRGPDDESVAPSPP